MMGDGWVGLIFFVFGYISKTSLYMVLIAFGVLRRHFKVSFVKKNKTVWLIPNHFKKRKVRSF